VTTIRHYLDGRLFEWTFSVGSVWLAVVVWTWPETVVDGAFRHMTDFMTAQTLVLYALATGAVGSVALATNGVSMIWGPAVRAVCATARSFMWGEFAYALWLLAQDQPAPSLGLGFWVLFTLAELYVAHRAMTDASVARISKRTL
jgi:hypothetical protein